MGLSLAAASSRYSRWRCPRLYLTIWPRFVGAIWLLDRRIRGLYPLQRQAAARRRGGYSVSESPALGEAEGGGRQRDQPKR